MTTHPSAFAAVAAGLAGTDPRSEQSVEAFYVETFPRYSDEAKALILDWLAAAVETPSEDEVAALVRAVRPEQAESSRAAASKRAYAES